MCHVVKGSRLRLKKYINGKKYEKNAFAVLQR